jgi:CNT family concentrative nucleoside transporter
VLVGLGLQVGIALLLLKVTVARNVLFSLNGVVDALVAATKAGTSFVFGYAGGGATPFAVTNPQAMTSFAFQILPLVIVISALAALLWYWRILPVIVGAFAWCLRKTMGIGGAIGLGSAATIFLGMIEAPLLIRPYLAKLTRAELFMLFSVGLATVAGTVFVLYATILEPVVPGALGHILVASFMSLPGAILIARIMVPGDSGTDAGAAPGFEYRSSMDAVARGTEDGLKLWLSIVAMLLVIVALVALADIILAHAPDIAGSPLTVERIFGWIFAPLVWLYGVPWHEAPTAGALMGDKTVLNEFVAYLKLAALPQGALDPRARLIMLYAMCGFANLGSVGILIAGVGSLVPERRAEIVPLAMRALISGTMASGLTGAIIGLLP